MVIHYYTLKGTCEWCVTEIITQAQEGNNARSQIMCLTCQSINRWDCFDNMEEIDKKEYELRNKQVKQEALKNEN